MIQRLPVTEDRDAEQCRRELDTQLKVKRWRVVAGQADPYEGAVTELDAPWWWDGTEEASSSFLGAMGVNL